MLRLQLKKFSEIDLQADGPLAIIAGFFLVLAILLFAIPMLPLLILKLVWLHFA